METSSLYWNWFSVKNWGIPGVAPKLVPSGSMAVAIAGIPTASGEVKFETRRTYPKRAWLRTEFEKLRVQLIEAFWAREGITSAAPMVENVPPLLSVD